MPHVFALTRSLFALRPMLYALMDVYPIHHKNLLFNLITDYDLTFKEVRAILDDLLDRGAFRGQDAEAGRFFDLEIEKIQYVVDVNGYEVVVYRRIEMS